MVGEQEERDDVDGWDWEAHRREARGPGWAPQPPGCRGRTAPPGAAAAKRNLYYCELVFGGMMPQKI